MDTPDELRRLISKSERYIDSATPEAALPYLHKAFFYSNGLPELRANACLKLARVCQAVGQPFIGAEFLREAKEVVLDAQLSLMTTELADTRKLFEHEPDDIVGRAYHELLFSVTRTWHQMGIPFVPSEGNLILANVHRDDDPTPFFSNISWWCGLPFEQPGQTKPPFSPLLSAFDTNMGPHVEQRFQKTVAALREGVDSDSTIVAAQQLPTLAIVMRVPTAEATALVELGNSFLTNGVPIEQLENAPSTGIPIDFLQAGLNSANEGADLFSVAFMKEARRLFELAGDSQGQRMAQVNEALALQRLGQDEQANVLASLVYTEANRVNDNEIIEAVRAGFPSMFDGIGNGRLEGICADVGSNVLTVQSERPFVADESSGKVVGGMLASEALTEFEASKLLNEAWNDEFPRDVSPFPAIPSYKSFEWEDPSFSIAGSSEKLDLGQFLRLTPLDGTLRLADVELLEVPAGHTREGYAGEFVSRVTSAVMVAHKRLGGAFSSASGTSISAGNVSTRGHVFDYETFRSPKLGYESKLSSAQIQDISMLVVLIHIFLGKLQRPDLMSEMMKKCAAIYVGTGALSTPLMEGIKEVVNVADQIERNRAAVSRFATKMHVGAVWRE